MHEMAATTAMNLVFKRNFKESWVLFIKVFIRWDIATNQDNSPFQISLTANMALNIPTVPTVDGCFLHSQVIVVADGHGCIWIGFFVSFIFLSKHILFPLEFR